MERGQLLISVPTVLEGAVLFAVNNSQIEVFLRLLEKIEEGEDIENYRQAMQFIEDWHRTHKRYPYMFNNGCGCAYCIKTREYANLKLSVHRLRSKLDDNYYLYPSERYKEEVAFLTRQEIKLKTIIAERKTMRTHLGFISKRVLRDY